MSRFENWLFGEREFSGCVKGLFSILSFFVLMSFSFLVSFSDAGVPILHFATILLFILYTLGFFLSINDSKSKSTKIYHFKAYLCFLGFIVIANVIRHYEELGLSIINVIPFWAYILIIVAVAEYLFIFVDKTKPKKNVNKLWFTTKKKLKYLLISTLISFVATNIIYNIILVVPKSIKALYEWVINNIDLLMKIGKTTGIIIGVIALLLVFVYLNSLKYRR